MTNERKKAARQFAETGKGRGYEKGESQTCWNMLLRDVLGAGEFGVSRATPPLRRSRRGQFCCLWMEGEC